MTFILQMGAGKQVSVHVEYLIYDLVAMISAIGGTMGLCIGFSFFDFCCFILSFLEKGVQKIKTYREVSSNTAILEVRSPSEQDKASLKNVLESLANLEGKMSSVENNIKALQIRVMENERK